MSDQAMAFTHPDGLAPTWKFAAQYAGDGGHIATLPEIIQARLYANSDELEWNSHFTTSSAEYFGRNREGKLVIVVAHGIGPMATLDGILKAYSHEFKDKTRHNRGGRISQTEFWKLIDGEYGEVSVVDYETVISHYKYPFLETIRARRAINEPLLAARFGPRTAEYIMYNMAFAIGWHHEQIAIEPENRFDRTPTEWARYLDNRRHTHKRNCLNPYILNMGDAMNCAYVSRAGRLQDGEVIAHLLSIGGLYPTQHTNSWGQNNESLTYEVGCHEWGNGARFVGVPSGEQVITIHPGLGLISEVIRQHWRQLLEPVAQPITLGLRPLMQIKDTYFTQYPKHGIALDTHEPEFVLTSITPIGDPVEYQTPIAGHHAFFKYDIAGVQAIAPPEAGGYQLVDSPEIIWEGGNPVRHRVTLQFYRITADTSKHVRRADQLAHDYDTLLSLIK